MYEEDGNGTDLRDVFGPGTVARSEAVIFFAATAWLVAVFYGVKGI